MTSSNTKIKQLVALEGTKGLTAWEESFIATIKERTNSGTLGTSNLTDRQVEVIESLFTKHYEQ